MIYHEFAKFYDDLFDDTLYDRWLTYTIERTSPNDRVLDLACGTGKLAVRLADRGYSVTGADLSEDMLTMADQLAQQANVQMPFFQVDMRDLGILGDYDAITCFDDSLCYLETPADLAQTFSEVSNHLAGGGTFLFDVISPYQTDQVYPRYMYNFQDDDRAFMWTSYAGDTIPHTVEHELSFFLYNAGKDAYDVYHELHHERTYLVETYLKQLKNAGFENVRVTTDFGAADYQPNVKRWFFEAKKES